MVRHRSGVRRSYLVATLVTAIAAVPVDAAVYLDNRLGSLAVEKRVVIASPRPVQLIFSFQTNGVADARATQYLQASVDAGVRASGAFAAVGTTSVADGGVLSVTVNNVPQKGAMARGAIAGATFFLVGTVVTDQYFTTVAYLPTAASSPISMAVEHAIYTKVGAKADPEHADKVTTDEIAIKTMVAQSLAHALNDIAGDPRFAPAVIAVSSSAVP